MALWSQQQSEGMDLVAATSFGPNGTLPVPKPCRPWTARFDAPEEILGLVPDHGMELEP